MAPSSSIMDYRGLLRRPNPENEVFSIWVILPFLRARVTLGTSSTFRPPGAPGCCSAPCWPSSAMASSLVHWSYAPTPVAAPTLGPPLSTIGATQFCQPSYLYETHFFIKVRLETSVSTVSFFPSSFTCKCLLQQVIGVWFEVSGF